MIFVACSGFPVPVSRYWNEFPAVEITETELGIPGEGTIRRWKRESPDNYGFSLLAPQSIGQQGFQVGKESKACMSVMAKLSQELDARAVVICAPDDFKVSRPNRAALKEFVLSLPKRFPCPLVIDAPLWKPKQVMDLVDHPKVTVAYDPLSDEPPPLNKFAYLRLPGPAGKRSRYDEVAVGRIAEHCLELKASTVFCVFRNIDMHTNGKTLRKKLKP